MDLHLLLDGWPRTGPPHVRLDRLLHRAAPDGGDASALAHDTLGMRNQRLLRLHRALGGDALEAFAPCPACAMPNSFAVPAGALLGFAAPADDAAAEVNGVRVRVPRMADLLSDDPRPLPDRCADPGPPSPEVIAIAADLLDDIDPAANPVFDLSCAGCDACYRATVDIASFVAMALDRRAARLLREIDTIAAAYGWSEQAIAALPAGRRRGYVDMIVARGGVA